MYRAIQQLVLVILIISAMVWYVRAHFYYVKSSFPSQSFELLIYSAQVEEGIKGCYTLKSLQPVDMFPHTPHIECVCLLELTPDSQMGS